MTMMVTIDDQYIARFEKLLSTLPQDAVKIKNPLDEEILQRVARYRSAQMKTTPFMDGLDSIREKLVSKL